MTRTFTAVFEQHEDYWVAYAEELPGANTHGATLEEAKANLAEAIVMVLEANRELAEREHRGRTVIREEFPVTLTA